MDNFNLFLEETKISQEIPFIISFFSQSSMRDNSTIAAYADWLIEDGQNAGEVLKDIVLGDFSYKPERYPIAWHKREECPNLINGNLCAMKSNKNSWKNSTIIIDGQQNYCHSIIEPNKTIYVLEIYLRKMKWYKFINKNIISVIASPKDNQDNRFWSRNGANEVQNLYFRMLDPISAQEVPHYILYYIFWELVTLAVANKRRNLFINSRI